MLNVDLPITMKPALTPNGGNVRTALDWQNAGGGKGRGKGAAVDYLENRGATFVAMLWKSGSVTVYTRDRNNGDTVRIRYDAR